MAAPRVTIMIPTYNQARYVGRAVESALAQDWENLEVVVGDDASTDATAEVLAPYLGDRRVRYFRNEKNLGRVANYRADLYDRATGDWAMNLDGDDWLTNPGYVSRAMSIVARNPGVALVFGDQAELDEDEDAVEGDAGSDEPRGRFKESTCDKDLPEVMDGTELFLLLPERRISLYHLTCVYDRRKAMDLDFYRCDILSADWESLFRLLPGNRVGYVGEVAGVWRGHGINATANKDRAQRLANLRSLTGPAEHAVAGGFLTPEQGRAWLAGMLRRKGFEDAYGLLKRGDAEGFRAYMARVRELDPATADRILRVPRLAARRARLFLSRLFR
ncbi:MAG: glycosyltransferase family 2 protein [Desulfovibrionaceae bacterium]|jgi:glycosyltransferase involved in cell wall biosynthesis|nr:glycosyltransferase family 2 protein [Desulfovibrionaceae bacterium]